MEMLVAVGLVVLMMSLFAAVFQIATNVMSKQKGLAENDQKARALMVLLKADLDKRTFRRVVAMGPTDAGFPALLPGPEDEATQAGYFSYSENDPYDNTDDTIQFTVSMTIKDKNTDVTPLYGRATFLRHPPPRGPATSGSGAVTDDQYLNLHQNQPEADDGQVTIDNASSSDTAEVCYFMRNGVLYRRVMLVRKPLNFGDPFTPADTASSPATPLAFMDPTYAYVPATNTVAPSPYSFIAAGTGAFYADFDFSAVNDGSGVRFHGAPNSLSNNTGNDAGPLGDFLRARFSLPATTVIPPGLSNPHFRFGYSIVLGRPREFATTPFTTGGSTFIGRFTHEETSHKDFTYPGQGPGSAPGFTKDLSNLTATLNAQGTVSEFAGGPRRGEDVVLSNVLGFDVKIFDDMKEDRNGNGTLDPGEDLNGNGTLDSVMDFRDIGYGEKRTSGKQGYYWHGANKNPTYGPKVITAATQNGTDGQAGVAGQDDDGDGTADNPTERGWPGSDDPANRIFDTWHSDLSWLGSGKPPFQPLDVGPDGQPGRGTDASGAAYDDDNNGTANDNSEKGAKNSDDRHPLRGIQIKVRYRDVATGQIRELTLVHSLLD